MRSLKDSLIALLPLVFLGSAGAYLFVKFINPPPPDHFIISTGDSESDYNFYAKQYQDLLKENGVALEIEPSKGATDNLKRLSDEHSDVDAGFVQDGLGNPDDAPHLVSIGSLFYEPLWIFYRNPVELTKLSQLIGKRIAIGQTGRSTQAVTNTVLESNGVNEKNTHFEKIGWDEAESAINAGKIDVAFFLGTPHDSIIKNLLMNPNLKLMSLDQAEAITKNIPFLHHLVLPHGTIDLKKNIPSQDTNLVSPTSTILVKDSLHPSLVFLLMQAITQVHGDSGIFEQKNEFPSDKIYQFPLADEAKSFYKSGLPFWQKHLPFWIATLLDRFLLLTLPLFALLFPVLKLIPRVYHWRIQRRIHKFYGELKFLETLVKSDSEHKDLQKHLRELDLIEERVNALSLPLEYSNHLYSLRVHIDFVRKNLRGSA